MLEKVQKKIDKKIGFFNYKILYLKKNGLSINSDDFLVLPPDKNLPGYSMLCLMFNLSVLN